MQVEVVRHDHRAKSADGLSEPVAWKVRYGPARQHLLGFKACEHPVLEEAEEHHADEEADQPLQVAHSKVANAEKGDGVQGGDEAPNPDGYRAGREQVECDARADNFLNVGSDHSELRFRAKQSITRQQGQMGCRGCEEAGSRLCMCMYSEYVCTHARSKSSIWRRVQRFAYAPPSSRR